MKAAILAPIMLLFLLGFIVELGEIAESTSVKTLRYTQDMSDAMDCAFRGVSISECSPNLLETDFEPEINRSINFSIRYLDTLEELSDYNWTNATEVNITEGEDSIIITFSD